MKRSKVETFIGFAIRAGKFRLGVNAISTLKKAELLIMCSTISQNSIKDAVKLAKKFRAKIILSKTHLLEDLVGKEHCKLMAITDRALSEAVLQNLDENFAEYRVEEQDG